MRDLTISEMENVGGGNILKDIIVAVVAEVVIEGGKALAKAMNEHAENCGQVIHDDPAGRGRALL